MNRCYGDEGARWVGRMTNSLIDSRLAQLFDLSKTSNESLLLTGDAGTGKSTILDQLAAQHGLAIFRASLGELAAEYGQVSQGLRRLIWKAHKQPSLLILEDIDLFFPRHGEKDPALFRVLGDYFEHPPPSGIVAATSRSPLRIAPEIKTLFEDIVSLEIPTPAERLGLLESISQSMSLDNVSLEDLAAQAHAFVAADLAHWCRLAEAAAIETGCQQVSMIHFETTLSSIRLSHLGAFTAEKPDSVRWSDIGGLVQAKQALEESAVWVYKHADAYRRLAISPSKGVLMHGPPGTGKTLLAKAVATESAANFLPVKSADLIKGHVGESEKAVAKIFQIARRCSPCVIFLDELETLFGKRETSGDVGKKLITQFLIEIDHLDTLQHTVLVLGATNHPESIDDSLLRPGRLDRMVYVGTPNCEERLEILKVLQRKTPCVGVDLATIATKTEHFTGADLKALFRKAGLLALKRRTLDPTSSGLQVIQQDLENALFHVEPSRN